MKNIVSLPSSSFARPLALGCGFGIHVLNASHAGRAQFECMGTLNVKEFDSESTGTESDLQTHKSPIHVDSG